MRAVFAGSVLQKGASKRKSDKKKNDKPGQSSEIPTKYTAFVGKYFKCDQDVHRATNCPSAAAMKEIMGDRAKDRRNILALTWTRNSQIGDVYDAYGYDDDLGSMARAGTPRVNDKIAEIGTNIQDIIMTVNHRINRGSDEN